MSEEEYKKNFLNSVKGDSGLTSTVDSIISELCQKYQSDDIAQDIISLFEDIIKFFAGREEDFISFDTMPQDQKEAIYHEIITIIELLKKLSHSADKEATIQI